MVNGKKQSKKRQKPNWQTKKKEAVRKDCLF
jgi:hypothetical protein